MECGNLDGSETKIAVVTGAGSGIGAAVAHGLAKSGIHVALVGRTLAKLEGVQESLSHFEGGSAVFACDVGSADQVGILKKGVVSRFGAPHILINGAGLYSQLLPIGRTDPQHWIETFTVNTIGPYLTSRAFMPGMIKRGWGRVINISSAAALADPGNIGAVYQLSKVALNFFTRQLARELDGTGITANAIHPGEVKTNMWAAIKAEADRQTEWGRGMREWVEMVERTGGDPPEKTVALVLKILSPESDDLNGQFLWINDGIQEARPAW